MLVGHVGWSYVDWWLDVRQTHNLLIGETSLQQLALAWPVKA